ncbi:TAXI family TRAP transporter solute-binding subunit [uncultured Thiodictyon sp.]|uniref:TAXI family TRAP transporter solute-binding subunit n=1 Tax=uncultured Thiodictyon sp. TaxID=1846217 RepID=UPI0025FEC847|nr:TAXI family TRAP transporter solute-binding subunit [uncultured Thiodictyon sp.]
MNDTLIPDRWHASRLRGLLAFGLPTLSVLVLCFYAAKPFIRPPTPSHIVISTGGNTEDYFAFAQNYARILGRNGITLEVRSSTGSAHNLAQLLDPRSDVDIAFLRGGLNHAQVEGEKAPAATLAMLGTIGYEPLWVFYRHRRPLDHLAQLKGKRLAVGPPGSETHKLAAPLLDANGLNDRQTRQWPLEGMDAAQRLEAGDIDAAFIVASADAAMVRRLLMNPQLRLMSLAHAEAIARRFPVFARADLPRGAIDFAADLPHQDLSLLATPVSVVIRKNLHPALQYQLLQAMSETHGGGGILHKGGEFPSPNEGDFPLSFEAKSYFKQGLPYLQRHFPFWIADRLERFWVLILPLIAVAVPLAKMLPSLYNWGVRSPFYRRYGDLRRFEAELEHAHGHAELARIAASLQLLEEQINHLHLPLSYSDLLYTFRMHLNLVRAKVVSMMQVDETPSLQENDQPGPEP